MTDGVVTGEFGLRARYQRRTRRNDGLIRMREFTLRRPARAARRPACLDKTRLV